MRRFAHGAKLSTAIERRFNHPSDSTLRHQFVIFGLSARSVASSAITLVAVDAGLRKLSLKYKRLGRFGINTKTFHPVADFEDVTVHE